MAGYSIDDAVAQVVRVLRDYGDSADEQLATDPEVRAFLRQAATAYSRHRVREVVEDVIADGTTLTSLPATFDADFGSIVRVELAVSGDWQEADPRLWWLYRTPTGLVLRWLIGAEPTSGEHVRITFTAPRSWGNTPDATTIADGDFYAVCDLGISIACAAVAQKYARTSEPLVNADVVAYRSKAQEWDGRARAYRTAYEAALGIKDGVAPASGTVNWDSRDSHGLNWLTHHRFTR